MPKYERKYKDLRSRIDNLQVQNSAAATELAELSQELDEIVTWIEPLFDKCIIARTRARNMFASVLGWGYGLPWE